MSSWKPEKIGDSHPTDELTELEKNMRDNDAFLFYGIIATLSLAGIALLLVAIKGADKESASPVPAKQTETPSKSTLLYQQRIQKIKN